MFQSLYLVINFPLGLKKKNNPCLMKSCKAIKHLHSDSFGTSSAVLPFTPSYVLIGEQMRDPASTYFVTSRIFLRMKWTDAKPKCHLCQLSHSETRFFLNNGLINFRFGNCRPGSSFD